MEFWRKSSDDPSQQSASLRPADLRIRADGRMRENKAETSSFAAAWRRGAARRIQPICSILRLAISPKHASFLSFSGRPEPTHHAFRLHRAASARSSRASSSLISRSFDQNPERFGHPGRMQVSFRSVKFSPVVACISSDRVLQRGQVMTGYQSLAAALVEAPHEPSGSGAPQPPRIACKRGVRFPSSSGCRGVPLPTR